MPSLRTLLLSVHAPTSLEAGEQALAAARRLAAFSIVEAARRSKTRQTVPASALPIPSSLVDELLADPARPYPMRRMLSGDVGCGKTIAYMIPALAAQRLGRQVVVLTPNALLAEQQAFEGVELVFQPRIVRADPYVMLELIADCIHPIPHPRIANITPRAVDTECRRECPR